MIYDVSMPLREGMPVYANNPPFRRTFTKEIARGASANQTEISLGSHTGTHVDAPFHFEAGGATLEKMPLESLVGPARLLHFPGVDRVDRPDLEKLDWKGVERVLFRTRNSDHWAKGGGFDPGYAYLSGPGAEFLAERRMKLVGIDALGVEQFGNKQHPTHHALLRAGIVVIEGLCLAHVPPGDYLLFCGPLLVEGNEGAPARVFLQTVTAGATQER
jgi:arylformamidase